jgi:hypothetical protein
MRRQPQAEAGEELKFEVKVERTNADCNGNTHLQREDTQTRRDEARLGERRDLEAELNDKKHAQHTAAEA